MSKSLFKLINKSTSPPRSNGEWTWIHDETGTIIKTMAYKSLKAEVKEFYLANNYPITLLWDQEFDDCVCRCMADNSKNCVLVHPQVDVVANLPKVTISTVKNFLMTMAAWVKSGTLVDQKEADRRASICNGCIYKVGIQGCKSCSGVSNGITKLIGNKQTKINLSQSACQICSCSLSVIPFVPKDIKLKYMSEEQRVMLPEHCWLKD